MSQWIPVCGVDDVEAEDVIGVQHEGRDIAIFRSPHDEYYATAGHCSHERQLLCDGLVMDGVIECPKHNGRIDYRTGKALSAPIITNIAVYPTRVDGDTVYIDFENATIP